MPRKNTIPEWWHIFITEYMKNGQNATQAYLKAKPKSTDGTAKVEGHKLLTNPNFQSLLNNSQAKLISKTEMSREKWLQLLADVAQADIKDYLVDDDGDIDLHPQWRERKDTHAIEVIDAKTTTLESGQVVRRVMVKKENKLKALEILGKTLGFLTDKVEHSGNITFTIADILDSDLRAKDGDKES